MKFHFKCRTAYLIPRNALLLAGILVLAAVLRFNNITQPFIDGFDWRQVSTAMMASNFYHRNWNILYPEVSWTNPTAPGYQGREFQTVSYIAALLYLLVGEHDWVGRSVAASFGLWGIFALYQLVRRVWDEEHALLSAAVMALLPLSIFIDRSFLPDPAMVALMTTSVWMLIAYLQTDRLHFLLLAGITGAWGLLSKLPGLIVGFAMVYATLTILRFRHRLNRKKLAVISIVAVLALLPVVAYYLWALHLAHSYPPYHMAGEGNWVWSKGKGLKQWWDKSYYLPLLSQKLMLGAPQPVTVLVPLGIIFPFLGFDREGRSQNSPFRPATPGSSAKAPWLFHYWLLGILPYYLIGAKELVVNQWNLHITDPAVAALSSYAIITISSFIAKLARPSGRSVVKVAIITASLITITLLGAIQLRLMYTPYHEPGYELGLALRKISQPRDLVVTMATVLGDPIVLYYSQRRGWLFPPPPPATVNVMALPEDDRESIIAFEKLRAEGAVWLGIVAAQHAKLREKHPLLLAHFQRVCRLYQRNPKWFIYSILPSAPGN
ncbi:MAG: glycosyl transferase [Verrucomicrobia bacterium]|nr:MAG: glycosyl transferase [Verrucomicrobiota bacterium]